jgi:hypothetical protein
MRLFKASGATYRTVADQSIHAFPYRPKDLSRGELVLLSKNREDCALLERQIQYLAKIVGYREATAEEVERHFPHVAGGERWTTLVRLHWCQRLNAPFNLKTVLGVEAERYDTVQNFAKIDVPHEQAIVKYVIESNPAIVLSFLDSPAPQDDDDWIARAFGESPSPAR